MYTSYFYFYSKIACINTDSVLRTVKGVGWSSSKYSGLDIFYGDFFCFARAVCERFTIFEPRLFWKPIYSNGFFCRSIEFVRMQHLKEERAGNLKSITVNYNSNNWRSETSGNCILLAWERKVKFYPVCWQKCERPYSNELQWISFIGNIF